MSFEYPYAAQTVRHHNGHDRRTSLLIEVDEDGAIKVHTLTLKYFRAKLVENFDILWKKEQIQWPSRTGLGPRPQIDAQFYQEETSNIETI